MKFSDLAVGQTFRFAQWKHPKNCVKQANDSYISGWGVFRFDPPTTNFFGGNGYLCPQWEEVEAINQVAVAA